MEEVSGALYGASGASGAGGASMTRAAAPPFTMYDFGWVVLCIGMAIGSGVVFLPVQMGVKGALVSIISLAIAYPIVYLISKLYIQSLSATKNCDDYAQVITQYLGKNWGMVLGVVYFVMLLKAMFGYSSAITSDAASYLETFGVTQHSLQKEVWFLAAVITVLVLIASSGERLLFKISGPLIATKLAIVVFLGFAMMPYWNLRNLELVWTGSFSMLRDIVLTLPFSMFSIYFVQILNPMNVAFRKVESDPRIATYRALRAMRYAYAILIVSVLFFCFSFLLSINHNDAVYALANNISGLALAAKVIPGSAVQVMSTVLDVAAIFTAFFGVFLGFQDAVRGIVLNVVDRFMARSEVFNRRLPYFIGVIAIAILVSWVKFGLSAMVLIQVTVPVYAFVTCLLPAYLVYRVGALRHLRSPGAIVVLVYGLVLMTVPVMKFFEH